MARGAPPGAPHKAPVCSLQSLHPSTCRDHSTELNEASAKKNGPEITKNKNVGKGDVVTTPQVTTKIRPPMTTMHSTSPQLLLDQEHKEMPTNKTINKKHGRESKQHNLVEKIPDEVFNHEFSGDITPTERQAILKEYNRIMSHISQNGHRLDEEVGLAEI